MLLPIEFARTVDFTFPSFYKYMLGFKFLNLQFMYMTLIVSSILAIIYTGFVYNFYPLIFGNFFKYDLYLIIGSLFYSLGLILDFITIHFITNLINKRSLIYFNILNLIYYSLIVALMYSDFNFYAFIAYLFVKQFLVCIFVLYWCRTNYEKNHSCN